MSAFECLARIGDVARSVARSIADGTLSRSALPAIALALRAAADAVDAM